MPPPTPSPARGGGLGGGNVAKIRITAHVFIKLPDSPLLPRGIADRHALQLALPTVVEIDHRPRHHPRAEHRGENTETQHRREPADRTATQGQQEDTGD